MLTPLSLLMRREVEHIAPGMTLRMAAEVMRTKRLGCLLICEGGVLNIESTIGIISESDFVRKGVALGKNPDTTPVTEIMSYPLITIDLEQNAQDANDLMAEKGTRHLLVTDLERIVGILSVRDLVICFKNRL
jgi:CBS domain-containing protein